MIGNIFAYFNERITNLNMIKSYQIFTILCLLCVLPLVSQINFTEEIDKLQDLQVSSGAPMAVADMDGDGLDDIISLDRTRELFISYQNLDGSFNIVDFPTVGQNNWGMTVGDITNNGSYELFTGGAYDNVNVVALGRDGTNQTSFMDGPSIFVQAVSLFDINNDGFLDGIACHDTGPNAVYMNDGQGSLSYVSDGLPFEKFGSLESNSGNYGNVWSDVNGDGLMDYYIAKCRQGVTDQKDERRINQLWINNGNGTFTESAHEFGLAVGLQSWTAEFQDIDNDGDMDCFITNHDGPSQLFENINNTSFVDITESSGVYANGLPIQAVMKDFDNDGYVDLFISGRVGGLFRNNGDKTFTEVLSENNNFIGGENSFACGDLNHDGFIDMMIGYGSGFNNPSNSNDKLWINNGNDNHWLAVQLAGVQSNKGGVGSRIELYGDWGIMVREVRAGESYGISHTLTQHIGIGQNTTIDSIIVKWPSGVIDKYEDILIDQFISIKENACIAPPSIVEADGPTSFCTGGEVTLTASPGYNYLWSNGSTDQSITVSTSDVYSVIISDGSECSTISSAVEVQVNPLESFEILTNDELLICEGESVTIANALNENVTWFDGSVGSSIVINETADVTAFTEGTCETISSNTLSVEVIPTPAAPTNFDYEFNFDEVTLSLDGQGIQWFDDAQGQTLLGIGNELVIENVDNAFLVYAASGSEDNTLSSVGEIEHEGSSDYNSDSFNGAMIFDVEEEIILRNVKVDTDLAGMRTIVLRSEQGTILEEKVLMVNEGQSKLNLNFTIQPGVGYSITTDAGQNFNNFGFESPRFKRTSEDFGAILNFPYSVDGLMDITGSNFGSSFYYYFYDWEVFTTGTICLSELLPYSVEPNSVSSLKENNDFALFPNPSDNVFNLNYLGSEQFDIRIMSMDGGEQFKAESIRDSYQVNLSNYASGMYIMEVNVGADRYFTKLIKL